MQVGFNVQIIKLKLCASDVDNDDDKQARELPVRPSGLPKEREREREDVTCVLVLH